EVGLLAIGAISRMLLEFKQLFGGGLSHARSRADLSIVFVLGQVRLLLMAKVTARRPHRSACSLDTCAAVPALGSNDDGRLKTFHCGARRFPGRSDLQRKTSESSLFASRAGPPAPLSPGAWSRLAATGWATTGCRSPALRSARPGCGTAARAGSSA